jgi:hypothetical protein
MVDKNRRDIGKSQSTWTDNEEGNARLTVVTVPPRDILCHDGRRRPNLLATTRTAPNRGNSGRQQVSDPSTLYGGGATSQSIGVAYWCAVPRRFHTRRRNGKAGWYNHPLGAERGGEGGAQGRVGCGAYPRPLRPQ